MKNRRLQNHFLSCSCGIITGDRGAGKSTLFAFIVDTFINNDMEVYCQYPYKDCFQIPLIETYINGVSKLEVDKSWLYETNLSNCCILIDEARTVWPARSYSKWTVSDDEFFNFLRKNNIHLFLATQAYDALDLNIRRACDQTYYLSKSAWFKHKTFIEASHTTLAKVSDKNTEVLGRAFKAGMTKVSYEVCEVPSGNFRFNRKKWYNKFISTYTFYEKPFKDSFIWNDLINFEELQKQQGYIEYKSIYQKAKEYISLFHKDKNNLNDIDTNLEFYDIEDIEVKK